MKMQNFYLKNYLNLRICFYFLVKLFIDQDQNNSFFIRLIFKRKFLMYFENFAYLRIDYGYL